MRLVDGLGAFFAVLFLTAISCNVRWHNSLCYCFYMDMPADICYAPGVFYVRL